MSVKWAEIYEDEHWPTYSICYVRDEKPEPRPYHEYIEIDEDLIKRYEEAWSAWEKVQDELAKLKYSGDA